MARPVGAKESRYMCLDDVANVFTILGFFVAIIAVIAAFFIPRKIMVDQIYADLVSEYRSPEMGGAILSIIDFFVEDCGRSLERIPKEYETRYNMEIRDKLKEVKKLENEPIDFAKTLHFQRRLVAQYYWDMATLRYTYHFPRLSKKQLRHFMTENETKLLNLILYMGIAATKVMLDIGAIDPAPEDDIKMNNLICQLFEEVEAWDV
ncbi:MAG: hypothetical protein LBS97_02595 [Treponema sp.]|nr:hypothetical protein [Treponema sp.]